MKKTIILSAAIFFASNLAFSQGTAINTTGNPADNSALLDVSSTSQGVLIPRMTDTEKSSISNPATGLIVYQTDGTPGFYYYDGVAWEQLAGSGSSSSPWSKSGSNIYPTLLADNVGIGTSNPNASALLDLSSTSKGVLLPRMTAAQRNAIAAPATGLQIFNTDCNITEYYNGSCWISQGQNLKTPGVITCSGSTVICANDSLTFSIAAVTGATSYIWTAPAGAVITSGQGTTSVKVSFGNYSGSICVTAENTCETSQQRCIDIHVNPVPDTPGNITGLTNVFPGENGVSYYIASIPGATLYNWTVPPGSTITSGVGTSNIMVRYPCNATTDSILVTASTNCGASPPRSLVITVYPILSASAGADVFGGVSIGGSPTASGGKSPYTYAWSPATNLTATTVANPTALCTGTTTVYTVTVTDANGCTATSSVTVTRSLTADAGGGFYGGAVIGGSPTGSGGVSPLTYSWSPATNLSSTSDANPTALCTGTSTTYTVTVTDANGCTATSSTLVTRTLTASAGISYTKSTGCDSIGGNPTASGGASPYSYAWSPAAGLSSTTEARPAANPITTTVYTVTVTDANGCTATSSMTYTVSPVTFDYTGSPQSFIVPACVSSIVVEAYGAQGANGNSSTGGRGAYIKGTFSVTPNDNISIYVGQSPADNGNAGGGGGSTGVKNGSTLLIVAGGGGGGGNSNTNYSISDASTSTSGQNTYGCGGATLIASGGTGGAGGQAGTNPCGDWPRASGGGGINSNGGNGDSGSGGTSSGTGGSGGAGSSGAGGNGFTGGGGASYGGGGGGGYSGGAGGASASGYITGGGGGSYNSGTSQTNTAGVQTGHGQVVITF